MKNNIKNDSGVALKAGVWYVVSSILVRAISIISTPIFTRLMTTEEYGNISTFTSWYSLLLAFCTLNLTYSIGRAKLDYKDKLDDYIGSMQLLSAIVTFLFAFVALTFIEPLSKFMELSELALVLLIIYLFFSPAINFFQNGFRYRYKYKENVAIAWYTAISTVILSLGLMLFTDWNRANCRMLGIVIPTILLASIFWIKSFQRGNLHINFEYWKYGIRLSGPLVLHTISLNILAQSDRIFIAKICGQADAGIYSLVHNYGVLISIITNAVSDGWLPWFHDSYFTKKYDEIKRNVKWVVLLGCFVGLACVALAPEAVMILGGDRYMSGVYCIPPIVMGILCQYVYTHYVNIEMHLKETKYISYGTIFAAILNIILNAFFIPMFGFVAAAYTTLFSYICLLFIHFFITKKILKVNLYNNWFMFGSVAITFFVVLILTFSYSYILLRYGIIIIGFLTFLWLFRNYIIRFLNTWICKKK
ncbi:lipopolysaccharide biosynthesis protein [Blautia hydrogenotrophica]|uniref:lipopolysaccharide biosynthesis protein n=1 Tax=Blautia hydrogenotrophica TaxID=53443 RepID=UPI002E79E11F|nr:oligosaccharide flippase family protein [Blautia hydrogenotrophica]MEE0463527.1 oligosaccharide flippase family protein [Blautia hydrogenotrophica]